MPDWGSDPFGAVPSPPPGRAPARVPRPPLGLPPEFGEIFRSSFRESFHEEFLLAFGKPFLHELRRAYDILDPEWVPHGIPSSEGFFIAFRVAFGTSWDASFPRAFKDAVHAILFSDAPPVLRQAFKRELRVALLARFVKPFGDGMQGVVRRAYAEPSSRTFRVIFRNSFKNAFRTAYGPSFMKAFKRAYP
jgi:hypothetical protein